MYSVHDLKCPGCGAPQDPGNKTCVYCGRPIVITSFGDMDSLTLPMLNKYAGSYRKALEEDPENAAVGMSLGMCYLKLRLYPKAAETFEKAMSVEFDNADLYFYAAIALLGGRKPFLAPRRDIDKIESYINAAISIEPKPIYYLLWSYVRYDYYFRKSFRVTPDYAELLATARGSGLGSGDTDALFSILGTPVPEVFAV